MEIFLFLWVGGMLVALIVYIDYDQRVQLGKEIHIASLGIERLYHQLNDWDVQQAIANVIASLQASCILKDGMQELGITRHSFPRQMVLGKPGRPRNLDEDDLYQAVKKYHEQTHRTITDIWDDINEHIRIFLETRGALREIKGGEDEGDPISERPRVRDIVRTVKREYRFFNDFELLHEAKLREIFEKESIGIFYIKDIPLLSFFFEYADPKGDIHRVVIVKDDLHQALKEFLLAHELGHWFLHFKSDFAERYFGKNYYLHSSPEWMPLEADADAFAMTALFPTPYLAELEIYEGELHATQLFDLFIKDLKEPVGEELKQSFLRYLEKRIKRYQEFKNTILPVRLPITSIEEEQVELLLNLFGGVESRIIWVLLNEDLAITKASNSFMGLHGISKEDLIGKITPFDLVVPEDKERMKKRSEQRMMTRRSIYYYTKIKHSQKENGVNVAVYSFPILSKGKSIGAIGILVPLDDISTNPHFPVDDMQLSDI